MAKTKTSFQPGHAKLAGAGRPKGSPNKKTDMLLILEEAGFSPAEALILGYKEAHEIFEFRKKRHNFTGALEALGIANKCASDLAQYIYPKKKAIEHSGEVGVKTFGDFIKAGQDAKNKK